MRRRCRLKCLQQGCQACSWQRRQCRGCATYRAAFVGALFGTDFRWPTLADSSALTAGIVDIPMVVPSTSTVRIQECHITAGHILCEIEETLMFAEAPTSYPPGEIVIPEVAIGNLEVAN